jgi:PAS domain S-box-containing protein
MTNEMVGDEWSNAQADLRRLFEENGHPMWVRDGTQIVAVNRAATIHYGYSRDEFLALSIGDLVVMDARDEPSAAKAPATNVAEHPHALSRHRRKDESFVDVEVLVAGPSGSGKTVLSNQFIVEGVSHGEKGSWLYSKSGPTITCRPRRTDKRFRSWSARASWRLSTCARWISRSTRPCWSFATQ